MPTYQYVCTECGEDLEAVQRFSDDPLTECPQCSGRLRKRFSPVGVVFKGSGFYKTDSRSSASSRNGSNGHSKATAETSSDSGSSESKSTADAKTSGSKDSSTTSAAAAGSTSSGSTSTSSSAA